MLVVPDLVKKRIRAKGLDWWLDGLPALVADLEAEWAIRVDGRCYDGGTEAFVADVTADDGTPAVLKLLIPIAIHSAASEMRVLQVTDGDGCVRLLRGDPERSAMLLERLGPTISDLGLPMTRRHEILVDTASRVWRHVPDGGFMTGAEKGTWLIDYITTSWEQLDRPCSERAVAYAVECAERRIAAHDDERAVLVHGDVHEWNTLQTLRDPGRFKLIDPDGMLAEAEYDLGVIMREDPVELIEGDPRQRARWLAHRTGLDETAIWEWGAAERLSTAFVCTKLDIQPVGRQMLHAAELVAYTPR
jgi:streptomycin 6-kinase